VISTLCRIGTQRHPFVFARFKPTVYEMLKSPENQNISDNMGSACVAMNRIEYGVKEELNMTATTGIVPSGFHPSVEVFEPEKVGKRQIDD
jgi:hypothetical protein